MECVPWRSSIWGLTKRQPMVVSSSLAWRWKALSALPMTKGARVIDSAPPGTASSISPARTARARPPPRRSTANTARSVTIMSTQALPVRRQRAALQDLRLAGLGGVLHHDDDALDAGHQVHGPAHHFHHLAGNGPVGDVAALRDLH